MNEFWNILASALSGGLAVQVINWVRNRRLSKARQGGDIDATYIDNINMLREELIKIQDENRKLYRAIARLDRTVAKAVSCRHWDDCPVRGELQKSGSDGDYRPQPKRQCAKRKTIRSDPPARSGQRSEDGIADGPPGCAARRGGI